MRVRHSRGADVCWGLKNTAAEGVESSGSPAAFHTLVRTDLSRGRSSDVL